MVHKKLILICLLHCCAFINAQQEQAAPNVEVKKENLENKADVLGKSGDALNGKAGITPDLKSAVEGESGKEKSISGAAVAHDFPVAEINETLADATANITTSSPTSTSTTTTLKTSSTTLPTTTQSTTPTLPTTTQSTTTTTASTSSTTAKTTTTTSTTTSTTKAPPTPSPGPIEPPHVGQWNSSCIIIRMATQLNFTYVTKDNKNATTLYNFPTNATMNDVECNSTTHQTIDLNWGPKSAVNMMLLQFDLSNKTVSLTKIQITIILNDDQFPNAKENQTIQLVYRGSQFKTPLQMSYHCTRSQKLNLTETVNNEKIMGTIDMSDVQVEAFRQQKNSTTFSTVHDCDASGTSDVVPIAVGLALVSLILIVLIAYLCARRRSTLRGYMSF